MKLLASVIALAIALLPARTAHVHPAPPIAHFDVVVTGGTPAGIAAAIAAARHGMRVALVTPDTTLGGALTGGMLTQWDVPPDGYGVDSEIFHEFYAALPDGFEPAAAAKYLRRRVRSQPNLRWFSGISALRVFAQRYGADRRITSLRFNRRNVMIALGGSCFIDATDNADMAAAAGAHYDVGEQDQGKDLAMQPATLIFTLAGVDWKRVNSDGGDQSAGYADILSRYHPLSARAVVPDANFQLNHDGTVMVNAIDVFEVDGTQVRSRALARRIAIAESYHLVSFLRAHLAGFAGARIARFAPVLYVRETRHVRGLMWIDGNYIWNKTRPKDTVALAAYPMDVHPVRPRVSGGDGWAEIPREYGIPLRALVTYGFANLAVVGPAMSATHDASGSLRVIPTAITEGEAAGTACAHARVRRRELAELAR